MGAEEGSNPSNTEQLQKETLGIEAFRMYVNYEQLRNPSNKIVGRTLPPEILSADNQDIEIIRMDGTNVAIINYRSLEHRQAALEKNLGIVNYQCEMDE